MKWNYQIIKDGNEYFLGEVIDGHSWAEIAGTRYGSKLELIDDMYTRFFDCQMNEVLEIRNGRLTRLK